MTPSERSRAVEVVRKLMEGEYGSDQEVDALVQEFLALVPDPNASNLIYWPAHHDLSRGLSEEELTPERIVDLACQYRPFAL